MENKNLFEFKSVSRENQVKQPVWFSGKKNGSPRIMFIGNSVTLHGPLASIGWHGNWGMAASDIKKDYMPDWKERKKVLDQDVVHGL